MESRRSSDETAREEGPSGQTDGAAAVTRVALGATDASTILLALGAVWWLYSVLHVQRRGKYVHVADEWLYPWEMPVVVWSIPCALAALALLVGAVRLQRPRESARRLVDLSALSLIASASAGIGMWLGLSIPAVIEMGIEGAIVGLAGCCIPGVPFWLMIIYAWHLRTSLQRADIVQACGGRVGHDEQTAARRRLRQNLASIAVGMVAATVVVSVYWLD